MKKYIIMLIMGLGLLNPVFSQTNYGMNYKSNEPFNVWDTTETKTNLATRTYGLWEGQMTFVQDIDSIFVYDGSEWKNISQFMAADGTTFGNLLTKTGSELNVDDGYLYGTTKPIYESVPITAGNVAIEMMSISSDGTVWAGVTAAGNVITNIGGSESEITIAGGLAIDCDVASDGLSVYVAHELGIYKTTDGTNYTQMQAGSYTDISVGTTGVGIAGGSAVITTWDSDVYTEQSTNGVGVVICSPNGDYMGYSLVTPTAEAPNFRISDNKGTSFVTHVVDAGIPTDGSGNIEKATISQDGQTLYLFELNTKNLYLTTNGGTSFSVALQFGVVITGIDYIETRATDKKFVYWYWNAFYVHSVSDFNTGAETYTVTNTGALKAVAVNDDFTMTVFGESGTTEPLKSYSQPKLLKIYPEIEANNLVIYNDDKTASLTTNALVPKKYVDDNKHTAGNLITLDNTQVNVNSDWVEEINYNETVLLDATLLGYNVTGASATMTGDTIIYTTNNVNDIFRSINGGTDWTMVKDLSIGYEEVNFSGNGQYVLVMPIGNSAPAYISANGGTDWTATSEIFTSQAFGAVSYTGQYMVMVSNTYILVSNDYGATFTQTSYYNTNYRGVSISGNGQYITVVASNSQIYISDDYGVTFTQVHSALNYRGVDMSLDGQIQYVTQWSGAILKSEDYGQTWYNLAKTLTAGHNISCSNDGRIVTTLNYNASTGLIYSTDYGSTWTNKYTGNSAGNVVLENETILHTEAWSVELVAGIIPSVRLKDNITYNGVTTDPTNLATIGYVDNATTSYTFGNGLTNTAGTVDMDLFTIQQNLGVTDFEIELDLGVVYWNTIDMSSSGQYITAGNNTGVYYSHDYGETWSAATTNPADGPDGLSVSNSGQDQVCIARDGLMYYSHDYGVNWSAANMNGAVDLWTTTIKISGDGNYATLVYWGDLIYISSDGGESYTTTDAARNWSDISMNYTGQYQIATGNFTAPYYSSDYGATWTMGTAGTFFGNTTNGVDIDYTGQYAYCLSNSNLYKSSDYGHTWDYIDANGIPTVFYVVTDSLMNNVMLSGNSNVVISTDAGLNFTDYTPATGTGSYEVAISRFGEYQKLISRNKAIYSRVNQPHEATIIAPITYTGNQEALYTDSTLVPRSYVDASTSLVKDLNWISGDYINLKTTGDNTSRFRVTDNKITIGGTSEYISGTGIFIGQGIDAQNSQSRNVVVGDNAMHGGNDLVVIGNEAGTSVISYINSGATLIGSKAAFGSTAPARAVIIGNEAGYTGASAGSIMIGYRAGYLDTDANSFYIGNNSSIPSTVAEGKAEALFYGKFDNNPVNQTLMINAAVNYYTGALTDGAPTKAEINAVVGDVTTHAIGWQANILDSDGTGLMYKIVNDGTTWHYFVGTAAL